MVLYGKKERKITKYMSLVCGIGNENQGRDIERGVFTSVILNLKP